jgi:hypothetical protein
LICNHVLVIKLLIWCQIVLLIVLIKVDSKVGGCAFQDLGGGIEKLAIASVEVVNLIVHYRCYFRAIQSGESQILSILDLAKEFEVKQLEVFECNQRAMLHLEEILTGQINNLVVEADQLREDFGSLASDRTLATTYDVKE